MFIRNLSAVRGFYRNSVYSKFDRISLKGSVSLASKKSCYGYRQFRVRQKFLVVCRSVRQTSSNVDKIYGSSVAIRVRQQDFLRVRMASSEAALRAMPNLQKSLYGLIGAKELIMA